MYAMNEKIISKSDLGAIAIHIEQKVIKENVARRTRSSPPTGASIR